MRVVTKVSLFLGLCLFLLNMRGTVLANPLAGLEHRPGFIDLYIDKTENRVLARLPNADEDGLSLRLIHTARLTAGLGSNPVGLDRGWGDDGKIIAFRRFGNKVVIDAENMTYRASPDNPLEQRAVKESFATSFLASVDILSSDNGLVVDLTAFLTSDVLGLVQYLKDRDQGSFSVAKDRSFIDTKNVFAFPDNVEMDVFFTLTSQNPGREVATTAANGKDATLIQHHSFIRLPEDGYTPLKSDPRSGAIERVYFDYSAGLSAPIETRLARRYRLEKDADGTTRKPIVFYIDSGAPEPIRSALVEGAEWWGEAFTAAGYPDGYRVEILPEDAHPLDIRYNVVQWVHRQTRGWSYGGGVSDPRTGEMLKGHVNLGSLRVRQDRMIFEGLAGTEKTDSGDPDDPVQLALARIRQLSAHEVGHALGFAHNFGASTYGKGSVMDYPAPDVRVKEGVLDFSQAYGVGIGEWDIFATKWLYGDLTASEREALIQQSQARGLAYVADSDGRGIATAHPLGNIWDNGADPIEALAETLEVRKIALENFGIRNIQEGQPVSDLNKVIVPIYLYHRYQTAAAAKLIGGMSFNYGLKGDGQSAAQIVPANRQRAALKAILKTLEPHRLDIKDETLALLTPNLISYSIADSERELFKRTAYPAFDVTAAADTAADLTFDVLLDPRRAARLIEFKRRDPLLLGFSEMLDIIRDDILIAPQSGRLGEISRTVQSRFVFSLMALSQSDASPGVKSRVDKLLKSLKSDRRLNRTEHGVWLVNRIDAHFDRPVDPSSKSVLSQPLPPGSPIGASSEPQFSIYETCWHCD